MKRVLSLAAIVFLVSFGGKQADSQEDTRGSLGATLTAADGVPIAYDMRGGGSLALVFVHGWCSNRTFWREQLDNLARDYRVVALDLPGHGDSGRDRPVWSVESFAEDVRVVVEALDLKRVVLVGHSMGGLVSLEAARRLPGRVIGMIGVDTISDVESEKAPETMDRVISALEADFANAMTAFMPWMFAPDASHDLVEWAIEESVAADHAMALALMEEVSSLDERELLSSVDVPVRCIYAAPRDPEDPRTFVETNAKYADYSAVFVEGVGHFLHLEDPEAVNRHIRAFLAEIERQ